MSTVNGSWQGPKITKRGLLIYLDPSSPNSFPQVTRFNNRSILRDISGNNNNGSLIGSPTFTSEVGGAFTLNGTSQWISCGSAPNLRITQGSISAWVKIPTTGNNSFRGIVTKQNAWGLLINNGILIAFDWGNYIATDNINNGIRNTFINLATNTWWHVGMTFTESVGSVFPGPPNGNAVIYVNGLPVLTTTNLFHSNNGGGSDQFTVTPAPVLFGHANFTSQMLSGTIAQGLVYNVPLTPSEMLQNYNATKSRFGL